MTSRNGVSAELAIEVRDLRKSYVGVEAVLR
jgi:hypothetical protein